MKQTLFPKAEVALIEDSISPDSIRLRTYKLRYWRGIHSEFMTHRALSKNAGSSRARPSAAIIQQVLNDPWGPITFGKNQKGMQSTEDVDGFESMVGLWQNAAASAAIYSQAMVDLEAHKQFANRILEPYTFIDVIASGTDFDNFFGLRCHKDADPTIQDLAEKMYIASEESKPVLLKPGQWHLPLTIQEDWDIAFKFCKVGRLIRSEPTDEEVCGVLRKISAARCGRTSYKAFDGKVAPVVDDIEMFRKLVVSQPVHASPTEHQATPDRQIIEQGENPYWANPHMHGNFNGWIQHRKMIPNETITKYVPYND